MEKFLKKKYEFTVCVLIEFRKCGRIGKIGAENLQRFASQFGISCRVLRHVGEASFMYAR